jgi:hypothetical protein
MNKFSTMHMRWAPKLTHGVIGLLQFVRFLKNLRINFLDCDCQTIFECAIISGVYLGAALKRINTVCMLYYCIVKSPKP